MLAYEKKARWPGQETRAREPGKQEPWDRGRPGESEQRRAATRYEEGSDRARAAAKIGGAPEGT